MPSSGMCYIWVLLYWLISIVLAAFAGSVLVGMLIVLILERVRGG
jgi:hypothetical protein